MVFRILKFLIEQRNANGSAIKWWRNSSRVFCEMLSSNLSGRIQFRLPQFQFTFAIGIGLQVDLVRNWVTMENESVNATNCINLRNCEYFFFYPGSSGLGPLSPHIQQNGFQNLSLPQTNSVAQSNYTPQSGPPPMAVAMNNQHSTNAAVGSVPVPCPPTVGVSGQGTWTGNSTLTYTQTMQPPDPRSHHPSYCKHNFGNK